MDRWQKVETLFHGALEQPTAERDDWLRQACGGDAELLHEVKSLVVNHLEHAPSTWPAAAAARLVAGLGGAAGQRLGPYELRELIGAGGMGEVYRGHDSRLGRDVAVKVTTANLSEYFEREARAIATLNHPNICHLYDVGPNFLVMELIEGTPLTGPLPTDQALDYARQIAGALRDAHEHGIVHGDLKPGNILLTPNGVIKILDFGLARNAEAPLSNMQNSPTITVSTTGARMVLGTAPYMAPEQARGKAVDKRADIWAFGCVLYEMLTGQRAFTGETTTDVLGAVATKEPNLVRVPAKARRLIETCLKKDPRQRLQAIGDWSLLLENPQAPPTKTKSTWPWIVTAAAVLMAVAGWLVALSGPRLVEHPLTRLSVDLGWDAIARPTTVAISPDGRRIVYPVRAPDGKQLLAMRLLDQVEDTLLPGTDDGFDAFFSPDGRWIGFYARSQLKKISVEGGSPVTLSSSPSSGWSAGASWSSDGSIIATVGMTQPLWRIPADGGTRQVFTSLAHGETSHRWPQALPDSNIVLFTATAPLSENDNIEAVSLKTGRVKVIRHGGHHGRYLPSGHLIYVHQGVLFGVKFDLGKLEVQGRPVPILQDLNPDPLLTGGGQFDFSNAGTLVYATRNTGAQSWRMDWLDSSGKMQPIGALGEYGLPRLSPDGRQVAYLGKGSDIYIQDLERGVISRSTFAGGVTLPVWAPDGKHLVFDSRDALFWVPSDGTAEPQLLLKPGTMQRPWSIAPDGRQLAYYDVDPETGFDIWTLPLDLTDSDHPRAGKPEVFLRTSANELLPRFSPDGRWIAYRSDESGSYEVYVRPFPPGRGGKWQISAGGGLYAIWSKTGRELFYETVDNRIMVVDYTVNGDSFAPAKPRLWSDRRLFYTGQSNLDLAPDGKRFLVFESPEAAKSSPRIVFLLNFFDELRRKIQ